MDYFPGLDVLVKETSVCIVDDAGKIVREARVATETEALLQEAQHPNFQLSQAGRPITPSFGGLKRNIAPS
jgi:transposase